MISWNELQVFWVEEQMNFFLAILFAGITARILGASMQRSKMETRNKKKTTEKAGN
jgi:hypothetical protein